LHFSKIFLLFWLLTIAQEVFAKGKGYSLSELEPGEDTGEFDGWYTGSLLAPSGHTVPPGWVNIEPYVYVTESKVSRSRPKTRPEEEVPISNKKTSAIFQIFSQLGITDWMDTALILEAIYAQQGGESSFQYGDMIFAVGFQLLEQKKNTWKPDIKLLFEETFPTGTYQRLNPNKLATEVGGNGSFQTTFGVTFQKIFYWVRHHPMRMRWFVSYTLRTPVRVHGFNAYGGGFGTDGRVTLSPLFLTIFGLELSLSKKWVFAMDFQYTQASKQSFSGNPGVRDAFSESAGFIGADELAVTGFDKSKQFSMAPAIEYNFSPTLGVLGGVWFSKYSFQAPHFLSYIISLNYIFPITTRRSSK